MKKGFQKIRWDKFRIRSRKDWVIFWIFAVIICYAVGVRYEHLFDRWLFQFANPYMTYLNQPYTWGQLMAFFFLLAMVTEAVLFLCKKPVKAKILVLTGALLMPMVVLAGYRIHTDLIVSSLWKEEPGRMTVSWTDENSGRRVNQIELTGKEKQAVLELCRGLTVVSDIETQEMLRQWYLDNMEEHFMWDSTVELYFAEKYGHSYNFWLRVCDGKVYLWRGYRSSGTEAITFFEDNGIGGQVEKIINSAASRTAQNTE